MSLISDMQRDLNRREAREQGRPAAAGMGLYWPAVLWGFAVVLLLVVIAAVLWPQTNSSVPAPSGGTQSSASVSSSVASSTASQASSVRSAASSSAPSPKALQSLLERAGKALAEDRLTRPATDSAYLYYQQAMALAPEHPAPRRGLEAIAERYRQLAEQAQDRGDQAQARRLAERGLMVSPDNSRLQALASPSSKAPRVQADTESAASASSQRSQAPAKAAPAVRLTLASREARVLEAARTLRRQGRREAALEQLLAYLPQAAEEDYAAPGARRLAQRWLIDRARLDDARALVVDSLSPPQRAFLQARVEVEQDELASAIARLERHFDSAGRDEPYRALLAALYRKNGQFPLAEGHYRRLLDVFGGKARYWLGLALALDQQGDYQPAAAAYRQVLAAPGGGDGVRAFAQRRLEQLGVQSP